MNIPELLLAFLAADIGLLGFAGIIALIDRTAARVSHEVASFRVRNLVVFGLYEIALAVVPLLAITLGGGSIIWRIACVVQALLIVYLIVRIDLVRRGFTGDRAKGMNLSVYYYFIGTGAAMIVLLGIGAAAYLPPAAVYTTGVFWFLFNVALMFMRLVFTLDDAMRNSGPRP
jgi:hypothetical protein